MKAKIKLLDLEPGNKVWCCGDSGFCDNGIEKVKKVSFKFDENTGEKYKVIHIAGERLFDSRNGCPLTPPLAYYIEPIEQ